MTEPSETARRATEPEPPAEATEPDAASASEHVAVDPDAEAQTTGPSAVRRVSKSSRKAARAIGTRMAAAAEPVMDRIGQAVDGMERSIAERPGRRIRRVRRAGANPLPYLNDTHPGVRLARPVQVGLRTIPVEDIAGTAVGGGDQRGGDFLPLKPFRGRNWAIRWQRLRKAQDDLAILPPIEVVKHGGRYWVVDGHNRVGLALYSGQPEIDATIVELVAPGDRRSEPILTLASSVTGSRSVRTAGEGHRPSDALAHEDRVQPAVEDDGP
jgi:hypothetical protein